MEPGIRRFAHVHLHGSECLDGAHECGQTHLGREVGDLLPLVCIESHELGSDHRQETLAEVVSELPGDKERIAPG
jgi:hypothetical protein